MASGAGGMQSVAARVRENVGRVIVGKDRVVDLVMVAVLCEGHTLIEDVPGIGKTTLARVMARSLGCSFRRIQCTPDLMPSDLTGNNVFNQKSGEFSYREGPLFAQVVLADEINRATPRTQSALLEAMEERQVTVDGETRPLPRPFLVLATQNPIELEGTFPLPEAQVDRFLVRLKLGYPGAEDDRLILERAGRESPEAGLEAVTSPEGITGLLKQRRLVSVSPDLRDYIARLTYATRAHPDVELGASPRAMLALQNAAQALAGLRGRAYVIPDDVKYLAPFVLEHRLVLKSRSRLRGGLAADILKEILGRVPVPVEPEPPAGEA
jgi:MoxR-like ATPase